MSQITISPGHYGPGTAARDLIDEGTETRKVVDCVVELLKNEKIGVNKVVDTQSTSQSQNLNFLVSAHNRSQRKLDVSIHFNSSGERTTKGLGAEVLYVNENLKDYASKVSKAISVASGLKNRGRKKRTELFFLNNTKQPAILIEVCFVNSTVDVNLYHTQFEKICRAIADELIRFVKPNVEPKPAKTQLLVVADSVNSSLPQIHNKGGVAVGFTSPSLISRLEAILQNEKLIQDMIQKGMDEKAFNGSWIDKLKAGTLTASDLLGLCALIVEKELSGT
ncbi:N-acetylmuramoyl-L-alanine amidase [Ureibacillus sp. NPDC094379]